MFPPFARYKSTTQAFVQVSVINNNQAKVEMEELKKLPREDFFSAAAYAWACQLTLPTPYQCDKHDPPSDYYFDSEADSEPTEKATEKADGSETAQANESQKLGETLSSIEKDSKK